MRRPLASTAAETFPDLRIPGAASALKEQEFSLESVGERLGTLLNGSWGAREDRPGRPLGNSA
jgi:hypothetical protein